MKIKILKFLEIQPSHEVKSFNQNFVDSLKRLQWGIYDQHKLIPIKTLEVSNDQIWTPRIDIANRLHNFSPSTERDLYSTVRFDGKIQLICNLET